MDLLGQLFTACGVGHVGGDNPLAHTGFAEGIVAFVLALQVRQLREKYLLTIGYLKN